MFSPIFLIEGVLVGGGICGWALWEYIRLGCARYDPSDR